MRAHGLRPLWVLAALLGQAVSLVAAERLPGVGPVRELLAELQHTDFAQRSRAEGALYLVPEEDLQAVEAAYKRVVTGREPDPTLLLVLLVRGQPFGIQEAARVLTAPSAGGASHVLAQRLVRDCSVVELKPLAQALTKTLGATGGGWPADAPPAWFAILNATADAGLWGEVFRVLDGPEGCSRFKTCVRYFGADACAPLLTARVLKGAVENRLALLRALRPGWTAGPPDDWLPLAKDPNKDIVRAFLQTLHGSTSPKALASARRAYEDKDPATQDWALQALLAFQGELPLAILKGLATGEQHSISTRISVWYRLSQRPDREMAEEARALVRKTTAPLPLREAGANYLREKGEAQWLLDSVSGLDDAMKAKLLTMLASSQAAEALKILSSFLKRAEPDLVKPVLLALARQKGAPVFALLLEALEDPREAVRVAADQALQSATGLHPRTPARAPAAAPAKRHPSFALWHDWYLRFGKPPEEGLKAEMEKLHALAGNRPQEIRAALEDLDFDPLPALTRMFALEQKAVARRIMAECREPRLSSALEELLDSLAFQDRAHDLEEVLLQRGPDAAVTGKLIKRLKEDGASGKETALRVLAGWRALQAASEIAGEVLGKGTLFQVLLKDLAAWAPANLMDQARVLAAKAQGDATARQRAVALLAEAGQEQDVTILQKLSAEGDPATAEAAAAGLAGMALRGIGSAVTACVNALKDKHPASALRMLRKCREAQLSRTDGSAPRRQVPPALAESSAALLAQSKPDEAVAREVFGVLANSSDPRWVKNLQDYAARSASKLGGWIDVVEPLAGEVVRPYVQFLMGQPGLSDNERKRAFVWMETKGGLAPEEVEQLRQEQARALARAFLDSLGKPADGLQMKVDFPLRYATPEQANLEAPVTLSNVGQEDILLWDKPNVNLFWRASDQDPRIMNFNSHPLRLKGPPGELITLKPGKSVQGTLVYGTPKDLYGVAPHYVRATIDFTVQSKSGASRQCQYSTEYREFTIVPKVWQEAERRYVSKP